MSQTRITVFGDLIETADMPTVAASLMAPGILLGCGFSVLGADLLGVGAGSILLPNGILVQEDTTKQLQLPNSSSPMDYTVIYQLEDSRVIGGSPAILRLLSGIQRQSSFTDSTVLGWIRYTGSSVPITDAMFIQPSPIRVDNSQSVKKLSYVAEAPFTSAVRPATERSGSISSKTIPLSTASAGFTYALSFGGSATRVSNASLVSDLPLATDLSNTTFMTYSVKAGTTVLYSYSTLAGTKEAAFPMVPNTSAPSTSFVVPANGALTFEAIKSGTVPMTSITGSYNATTGAFTLSPSTLYGPLGSLYSTPYTFSNNDLFRQVVFSGGGANSGIRCQIVGVTSPTSVTLQALSGSPVSVSGVTLELQGSLDLLLTVETPATTGKWTETHGLLSNEAVSTWRNISTLLETYTLQLPWIIESAKAPQKLLTRLAVDFGCTVHFQLRVGTSVISCTPDMTLTTGLVTKEYQIPYSSTVVWTPGVTALIEVIITAQKDSGASLAFIGLNNEPSPFQIFAPTV